MVVLAETNHSLSLSQVQGGVMFVALAWRLALATVSVLRSTVHLMSLDCMCGKIQYFPHSSWTDSFFFMTMP